MAVKKKALNGMADWRELFLSPLELAMTPYGECFEDIKVFYPRKLDEVPVEERHREGFFFDDELQDARAEDVRYVRLRSVGVEEVFDEFIVDYVPLVLKDVSYPNLEKVVGEVRLEGEVALPSLESVSEGLSVFAGKIDLPSLKECPSVFVAEDASLSALELEKAGRIIVLGRANFSNLEKCCSLKVGGGKESNAVAVASLEHLREISSFSPDGEGGTGDLVLYGKAYLPALETASNVEIFCSGDYCLESLRSVRSYVNVGSEQLHLVCPSLRVSGGLIVKGKADLPVLESVGLISESFPLGSVEVKEGASLDASTLRTINGDFELCNRASADVCSLVSVGGDMFVNCGHWISVGTGGTKRTEIQDRSPKVFEFKSLKSVGKSLELYANCTVSMPSLEKVGKSLMMDSGSSLKAPQNVLARSRFVTAGKHRAPEPGM